jgi:CRP/FNR family transcriptional regulator, cyclic AMP receptor protein
MDLLSNDAVGYLASCLVLATFAMRTMSRLHVLAILSNIAFIYYAVALELPPVLALHPFCCR